MYNKGYRGERYSTLTQINAGNAGNLKPVCMFQLGELGTFSTGPVMYEGILYVTTHLGTYAIDATTCKKLWAHQHVAQGPEMNATNKGVAIAGGRVIRGTQDGFLYALDAKTGAPLWVRQVADWSIGEGIGAAPIVWNDIVYVAKAGGDWGIRGRMMAFNVADGTLAWTFDLIPQAGEPGANTWLKPQALDHGGGAAWVTYALDRDTGTLFVPVGNPGPDYRKDMRPGANLFSISTVALDAKTGKLKWWYQLRANDDHDWDATVVSLFDAGGKKLVATAGKEGILHVVRREDGKLVFKLPVTTVLNHDVPFTPAGVRVCPVAGVQWNGAAHSPQTGLLYVNAIDWCTVFKSGKDPKWVATVPYTGLANGWGSNDPISMWSGWTNAVDPRHRQDGMAREVADTDVRSTHPHRGQRALHRRPQRQLPGPRCPRRQDALQLRYRRPGRRRRRHLRGQGQAVRRGGLGPQRRLDPAHRQRHRGDLRRVGAKCGPIPEPPGAPGTRWCHERALVPGSVQDRLGHRGARPWCCAWPWQSGSRSWAAYCSAIRPQASPAAPRRCS